MFELLRAARLQEAVGPVDALAIGQVAAVALRHSPGGRFALPLGRTRTQCSRYCDDRTDRTDRTAA